VGRAAAEDRRTGARRRVHRGRTGGHPGRLARCAHADISWHDSGIINEIRGAHKIWSSTSTTGYTRSAICSTPHTTGYGHLFEDAFRAYRERSDTMDSHERDDTFAEARRALGAAVMEDPHG
jgi:hypothetical protein